MGWLRTVVRCWQLFVLVVVVACGTPSSGTLDDALAARRSVRVIVGVRTPMVAEGALGPVERANQRGRIASAQLGARARFTGYAVQHLHSFASLPFMVLRVDDRAGLDRLRADSQVTSIEEDRISDPVLDSTTPIVQAPQAWMAGYTGAGYAVAVIDSGVMNNHDHLAGKVISEACFSTTDVANQSNSMCPGGVAASTAASSGLNCPLTTSGCEHGTHVANIAAGANATYNGVAKGANLIAIMAGSQFTNPAACPGGAPCVRFYTSDWIKGLERVLALAQGGTPVAAVNMSLGGGMFSDQSSCDVSEAAGKLAIDNLRSAGVPTVIASGNDGFTSALGSPGCISSAISVGATTDADAVASFSNSASFLHVLAPGVNVTSAVPTTTSSVATFSGTSMATPHVAGAIAVLKQARPSLTVDEVVATLEATGTPVTDARNGIVKPRINVLDAITFAQAQLPPPMFSVPGGSYPTPQSVAITTATPGASIHVTVDGSAPTINSTLYTSPIFIPSTTTITIRAGVFKTGALQSPVVTQVYDVAGTIATPVFDLAAGTYPVAQSVSIGAPTTNTTLHVTTDGTTPTGASPVYAGPIAVPLQTTTTIKAIATHAGWTDSAIATATYVVTDTVQPPQFSVVPGTYATAQSLVLTTATPGGEIRYTTDGSPATSTSTLFTGTILLPLNTTTTVRALARRATWADSPEVAGTITITDTVATPTATPPGGTFAAAQLVSLATATPGATIRFTTDGSPATAASPVFGAPIAIPTSTTLTIRARAFRATWADSAELVETYDITGTVATPVLSPAGGTFASPQSITIATSTAGATIRFTIDGSAVTATSPVYSAAISVPAEATVMIRARAFKASWTDSAEATGTYAVVCTRAAPTVVLAPSAGGGAPGVLQSYLATITNSNDTGCLPAAFALTRSAPTGWTTSLSSSSELLASGQQVTVQLDVTSASDALAGDTTVSVTASNAQSGNATGTATYTVTCTRAPPTLALTPATQSGQAGNALAYTATLTNHDVGCAASTFTLGSTVDAGWTGTYGVTSPSVASGASTTSTLTVTSALGTALGDHAITAAVSRAESTGASATAIYTVAPTCMRAAPSLVLTPTPQTALRGATISYTASLTNHDSACGSSSFSLTLTLPSGWTGSAGSLIAGSGATASATVDVTSAASASSGDYTITVGASAAASGSTSANATYTVLSTCVRQPPVISVTQPPASTAPAPTHYAVHVMNNDHVDCGGSSFSVVAAVPAGWTAPAVTHTLTPGTLQDFDVVVTPPTTLGASSTTFDLTATNTDAPNFTATGTGLYVLGCEHAAPTLAVTTVTENARYAIKVANHDTSVCASSTFRVKLTSQLKIDPSQADVAAGPGMEGAFEVGVTPATAPGDYDVHVTVTRIGDGAVLAESTITVTVAATGDGGGGGGCQAPPSPSTGAVLLLGLALVLRKRRR